VSATAATQVRELVAAVFGVPVEAVTAQTVRDDVDGWDSVGQLNLMLAVEDAFDVRLSIEDMQQLVSVEAIVRFVAS
jgi:acyl carrier protein